MNVEDCNCSAGHHFHFHVLRHRLLFYSFQKYDDHEYKDGDDDHEEEDADDDSGDDNFHWS